MPKVSVEWQDKLKFIATDEAGHNITMDAPVAAGGENSAPAPLSLILMSVAGCSGVDIISFLDKMAVRIDDFKVEVDAERAGQDPKVYTVINVLYKFKGENIPADKMDQAIRLSVEKYCSAAHIVNKTAKMNYSYEINETLYRYQPSSGINEVLRG